MVKTALLQPTSCGQITHRGLVVALLAKDLDAACVMMASLVVFCAGINDFGPLVQRQRESCSGVNLPNVCLENKKIPTFTKRLFESQQDSGRIVAV